MSKEVAGVRIAECVEPIRTALATYSDLSDGRVVFDLENAGQLTLTPDKPNSARSATPVKHLGEVMGDLYVIAFKPGDGTGDGKIIGLNDVDTGKYPHEVGVVPRPKTGIYSETHLTIATHRIEEPNLDPVLFAGSLSLLGLIDGQVVQIGQLGQAEYRYEHNLKLKQYEAQATATYTVGYDGEERFGDPHSVFNTQSDAVQICGFLAVTDDLAGKHQSALVLLGSELRLHT